METAWARYLLATLLLLWSLIGMTDAATRVRRRYYMCPPDFIRVGHSCYFFSKVQAPWQEATFECKDKNSTLAEPKTQHLDQQLRDYMNKSKLDPVERWIGGFYNWLENQWRWGVSGEKMNYNAFYKNQDPSRNESENSLHWHCSAMNPLLWNRWSADLCIVGKHYICETRLETMDSAARDDYQKKYTHRANEIEVPESVEHQSHPGKLPKHPKKHWPNGLNVHGDREEGAHRQHEEELRRRQHLEDQERRRFHHQKMLEENERRRQQHEINVDSEEQDHEKSRRQRVEEAERRRLHHQRQLEDEERRRSMGHPQGHTRQDAEQDNSRSEDREEERRKLHQERLEEARRRAESERAKADEQRHLEEKLRRERHEEEERRRLHEQRLLDERERQHVSTVAPIEPYETERSVQPDHEEARRRAESERAKADEQRHLEEKLRRERHEEEDRRRLHEQRLLEERERQRVSTVAPIESTETERSVHDQEEERRRLHHQRLREEEERRRQESEDDKLRREQQEEDERRRLHHQRLVEEKQRKLYQQEELRRRDQEHNDHLQTTERSEENARRHDEEQERKRHEEYIEEHRRQQQTNRIEYDDATTERDDFRHQPASLRRQQEEARREIERHLENERRRQQTTPDPNNAVEGNEIPLYQPNISDDERRRLMKQRMLDEEEERRQKLHQERIRLRQKHIEERRRQMELEEQRRREYLAELSRVGASTPSGPNDQDNTIPVTVTSSPYDRHVPHRAPDDGREQPHSTVPTISTETARAQETNVHHRPEHSSTHRPYEHATHNPVSTPHTPRGHVRPAHRPDEQTRYQPENVIARPSDDNRMNQRHPQSAQVSGPRRRFTPEELKERRRLRRMRMRQRYTPEQLERIRRERRMRRDRIRAENAWKRNQHLLAHRMERDARQKEAADAKITDANAELKTPERRPDEPILVEAIREKSIKVKGRDAETVTEVHFFA